MNLDNSQKLSKAQQKLVSGGYIPTLEQFCCGSRWQGWRIQQYPFLGNDPYYKCTDDVCNNGGAW
ncbi:hypothetical protein ACWGOQ_0001625 [Aquimarina sp. M1]